VDQRSHLVNLSDELPASSGEHLSTGAEFMADEKKPDQKSSEDLTPTPTQAEMDETMAKLSGTEVAKKREVDPHHPTPTSTPPTMTQDENDEAHLNARPGDDLSDPKKREAVEAKRKKEMEAVQPAGYQTRVATPAPSSVKK
jgi:hypothetical protein